MADSTEEDSIAAVVEGNLPQPKASTAIHMEKTIMNIANKQFERPQVLVLRAFLGALLAVSLASCEHLSSPQQLTQPTFASAEEAGRALFAAAHRNDEQALTRILGGEKELASSGDEIEDKLDRELFVQKYREMHRLVRETQSYLVLLIGAENWPFPVPLVSKNGRWYFDSKAGAQEIMFRRVGENESVAIGTCHALVLTSHQPSGESTADDPMGQFVRTFLDGQAKAVGAAETKVGQFVGPFYGYDYRRLAWGGNGTSRSRSMAGGIVFVAYPVRYRTTGVMTFLVTQDNIVYEKDCGSNTTNIAKAMTGWRPDATWQVAK
jgi:hypothetical protein